MGITNLFKWKYKSRISKVTPEEIWEGVGSPDLSFSQAGEDRIIYYLFSMWRQQTMLYYIDIGSADPVGHNNTFYFYRAGGTGVTVEADPRYKSLYQRYRSRDVNICAAIVPRAMASEAEISFARMKDQGRSAITKPTMNEQDVETILTVPTITIDDIFARVPPGQEIDLLSIDIEGLDHQILKDMDFTRCRVKAIIAENDGGIPIHNALMESRGYSIFAFNTVNSIYIDKRFF